MKRLLVHCLLVTAGLLVFGERRADAQDVKPSVRGLWVGTYQSNLNPRLTGPAYLDITMQNNARFAGELTLMGLVPTSFIQGAVSASGEVTFIVFQRGMGMGEAHGIVDPDLRHLRLAYRVQWGDGGGDQGTIELVSMMPR
jgi:hypothetical protein